MIMKFVNLARSTKQVIVAVIQNNKDIINDVYHYAKIISRSS